LFADTADLFVSEQFVSDVGQGPPLLLVHGFPLHHQMWREQMAVLSSRQRVIAPDLRGFGASPPRADKMTAADTMTMEDYADDLNALLEALAIREPVTLCGLSMGGYIAFQFWRKHPERVARLILCDTRAVADTPEAAKGRLEMADRALKEGASVAAGMLPKLLAPATQQSRPELTAFVREMIEGAHPRGIAAAQRGMAERPDMTSLLPRINIPTLVIVGAEDAISTPAEMQTIAAAIPGSVFVSVPEAGHLSPLENPEVVNRAIQRFLGH
jgi:3-oxoadipate enol-lactonase